MRQIAIILTLAIALTTIVPGTAQAGAAHHGNIYLNVYEVNETHVAINVTLTPRTFSSGQMHNTTAGGQLFPLPQLWITGNNNTDYYTLIHAGTMTEGRGDDANNGVPDIVVIYYYNFTTELEQEWTNYAVEIRADFSTTVGVNDYHYMALSFPSLKEIVVIQQTTQNGGTISLTAYEQQQLSMFVAYFDTPFATVFPPILAVMIALGILALVSNRIVALFGALLTLLLTFAITLTKAEYDAVNPMFANITVLLMLSLSLLIILKGWTTPTAET